VKTIKSYFNNNLCFQLKGFKNEDTIAVFYGPWEFPITTHEKLKKKEKEIHSQVGNGFPT